MSTSTIALADDGIPGPEQDPYIFLEEARSPEALDWVAKENARTLAAFEAAPGQGITLHADTWHHPLIALATSDFFVIERAGAEVDCELSQLASPVRLVRV